MMASHHFGALIDVESSGITDPPAVLNKDPHGLPDLPTAFELDELNRASRNTGASVPPTPSGAQTPRTLDELEQSTPPSPDYGDADAVDIVQSWNNPPINRYRLLSACLMNFGNGMVSFSIQVTAQSFFMASREPRLPSLSFIEFNWDVGFALKIVC